jgi:putative aldouronate transport system substrate-binding protein
MRKCFLLMMTLSLLSTGLWANGQQDDSAAESSDGIVMVELWRDASSNAPMEKDYPQSLTFQEKLGVGIYGPQIAWNGGKDYAQRLRLNIASGKLPDMFQPVFGMEYDLAEQGAIAALDDLLPQYAPTLYNRIPESVWKIVRANSPDGKIYYIPRIVGDLSLTGFIRKDWLDRVGMDVPETISEYEEVLRAFKDNDANENGDPNDEIPTSGRQDASWMDHLFAPFGVAINEGAPLWHEYGGELTFAAVTDNMKAALKWQAELYQEGLLDEETLLNSKKMWDGKVKDNRVGSWFHGAEWVISRLVPIYKVDPEMEVVYLPALKAPGYDGFYSRSSYLGAKFVFSAENEEKVIAGLKILEYLNDPANLVEIAYGYEGVNYKTNDNGDVDRINIPSNVQNPMKPVVTSIESEIAFRFKYITEGELVPLAEMITKVMRDIKNKNVDGQGIPYELYDGYPDIYNNTLYKEYASLIILGSYDMSKFDEFVEKWYATGGDVVTKRIREWYKKSQL